MTPKEKAKQLVKMFKDIKVGMSIISYKEKAKQCAELCADEMMQNNYEELDFVGAQYFKEVKEEINKI
jgi:hypothetical protein